ncbi:hypothetical protein Vretimale_982 [Volvox reticuliferus]|uniref:Uncharacterized protein n=1 Tax=Volvox reticuliferus TaxID=1737510 RepID=A0A8J4D3D1_9CHLO|nr:hypothetical protein Vretifemale_10515 [Volvox reticuliferus]GIL94894.1 hypothetical protein Vretimale_982 [Volvox reticuliferus]
MQKSLIRRSELLILRKTNISFCANARRPRKAVLWRELVVKASQQQSAYENGSLIQDHMPVEKPLRSSWGASLGTIAAVAGNLFRAFVRFVVSCRDILPHFTVLSPQQALQRMILILAASLLMVVLLTTIDSGLLYVYVLAARRGL